MKVTYSEYQPQIFPFELKLPDDFNKRIKKAMYHSLVYDRFKKTAYCTHCEASFKYNHDVTIEYPGGTIYAMQKFYSKDLIRCPVCNKLVRARPHTSRFSNFQPAVIFWNFGEDGIAFCVLSIWIDHEEKQEHEETKYEVLIFQAGQISSQNSEVYVRNCIKYSKFNLIKDVGICTVSEDVAILNTKKEFNAIIDNSFMKHRNIGHHIYDHSFNSLRLFIKRLELNAKYPQVEYIEKLGYGDLVEDRIYKNRNYIRPNWNAKTIPSVLGLSSQEFDKLKNWDMAKIDDIAIYKRLKKQYKKPTKKMMEYVHSMLNEHYCNTSLIYQKCLSGIDVYKWLKFIENIYGKSKPKCSHGLYRYSIYTVIKDYKDYLEELEELEYPKNDYYLYPKDFAEAHSRTSKEVQEKLDAACQKEKEKLNKKYEKKLARLYKYEFKKNGLFIRPLESYEEFRNEGRVNNNCVASYFDRVAEGTGLALFAVRHVSEPGEVFYTAEINFKSLTIIQCRGKGNCIMTEEVEEFIDQWLIYIKSLKKERKAA